jgi:uncharacterized protein (TIGR03083 family)
VSSLAARSIAALRAETDELHQLVPTLSREVLTGRSGASEWSPADVLSHLGSQAEIHIAILRAAVGEGEYPTRDHNRSVWDRWDNSTPEQQSEGYLLQSQAFIDAIEALSPRSHDAFTIPLDFLPIPLSVASYAGFRLSELAHHGWDVRVAADPEAGLGDVSTAILFEQLGGELDFLLGFYGKPDRAERPFTIAVDGSDYTITVDDKIRVTDDAGPMAPTESGRSAAPAAATFHGSLEAALRLMGGRLGPQFRPAEVTLTGDVTFDDLAKVFPGF